MGHRDFQDILTDLDEGKIHTQAGAELRKVVAAVMETGKKGTVNIRIDVSREGRKAIVKASVKATVPLAPADASIFSATEDGELRRDDSLLHAGIEGCGRCSAT